MDEIETVDARGMACPQPVIMAKKALEGHSRVTVIVDDDVARENVRRLGEKMGCTVSIEQDGQGPCRIEMVRGASAGAAVQTCPEESPAAGGPLVVAISSDRMGRGSDELGDILMRSFIHTLLSLHPLPDTLLFYNTGVMLAVNDSLVLDDLRQLDAAGVRLVICGTCTGYFGLTERIGVGTISNMYDIADAMAGAGRLIVP